jgi:RNA polymerase sigma-70 factor (ECF subfamily)
MTARLELVPDDRSAELALAQRAVAGDEGAFEAIYRANARRVFGVCLRMGGTRERATELTQDVFVHVWQRLGSWRGESALSSWIYRVAVNLVLSNVRGESRRLTHEMSEDDAGYGLAENREPSPGNRMDLERAISGLPAGARTVFVLHDVEGYQHAEIARMTGTAEGTCRAQLHRARRLLMEALNR